MSEMLDPIKAIEVKQGTRNFYIFTISAKLLLSVSYTSERTRDNRTGIQRGLRKDRLREIGNYYKNNEDDIFLPNAIIISLSSSSKYSNGELSINKRKTGEAFVIDGQHRLWSFSEEFCGEVDSNILVSAYIDLDDSYKAHIFRTINGKQKKINPSLVYDLIPMLRESQWVTFEDRRTQELVSALDTDRSSDAAWSQKISMTGERGKIISQSSFITAIKKLYKKGHIFSSEFNDFFEAAIQEDLLKVFFNSLAKHYRQEWDNKLFYISKYIGVSACLLLLEDIIKDLQKEKVKLTDESGLLLTSENLDPYFVKLRQYNFSAREAKANGLNYVGESGVKALYVHIKSFVFV